MRFRLTLRLAPITAAPLLILSSCTSPFDPIPGEAGLRATVDAAIERELRELPASTEPATSRQAFADDMTDVERALADRREELDGIGPALRRQAGASDLGTDLSGQAQQDVALSLQDAIVAAVRNNLGVAASRLQPAITEADVIAAEAAFDAVFFAGAEFQRLREPTVVPVINNVRLGTGISASDRRRFETGVRLPLRMGGSVSLSTDFSRSNNRAPGFTPFPDPAHAAAVRLGYVQPLLRGFGQDANTAVIRLSRNTHRSAVEQLRLDLMRVLADTEFAYWGLVFAWQDLEIQQWLVDEGAQVRDVLERRRDFDARPAEYADAVATVEQRKAGVVRARRQVRAASDRLKTLINHPDLNIGGETIIFPVDVSMVSPVAYSMRDTVLTAIQNRPEIYQAMLRIDDAGIRQRLASNARLPRLDLGLQLGLTGLDDSLGGAYEETFDANFVGYLLSLMFEVPIGNRAADAEYRQSRLQRSASVIAYRQAVQNVIADVKAALRDVATNYELIQASRSFRIAQAENLRALLVREELVGLTPEFLNLKFTRQATLAQARQQELLAMINYDQAVAQLHRAMGVGLAMNGIDLEYADLMSASDLPTESLDASHAPR